MCPTRIQPKLPPIELDLSAAFSFEQGFGRAELLQFGPQLEQARAAILEAVAAETEVGLKLVQPRRILAEYHRQRKNSLLGRILALAKRLRETVDSVVILGPPALTAAAHALLAACGHPHHNRLSRGQRGGRPRIYFAPAVPDNDALQALLEILPHGRLLHTVDDRWGLIALDEHLSVAIDGASSNGAQLLTGLFSLLWDLLQTTTTAAEETQLAATVGPQTSPLMALAEQIGLSKIVLDVTTRGASGVTTGRGFVIPRSDHFHAGVLLAGSVMGLDIVKLLHGAAAMWQRFAVAAPGDNPPLDLAGLCLLLARRFGNDRCVIDPSEVALAPLANSLFHSPGAAHPTPLVQWLPQSSRADRLCIKMAGGDAADRKKYKERLLTDLAAEQAEAVRTARTAAGQFTAVTKLPVVDESAIGQLIELHWLAAVVENALIISADPTHRQSRSLT